MLNTDSSVRDIQEGDEILLTVRASPTSELLFQKSGPEIIIEPEDTAALPFGTYCYDVQITLTDGTVDTVIPKNDFVILEEVTY